MVRNMRLQHRLSTFTFSFPRWAAALGVVLMSWPGSTVGGGEIGQALACSTSELKAKECLLQQGPLRLQFRAETIVISDGTWRGLVDMPIRGEQVEWVALRYREMAGRQLVEILLWGEPSGEASLQSLTWIVGELKSADIDFVLSEVVSKRRFVEPGVKVRQLASLSDQREPFGLKTVDGQGQIHWWAGRRSGRF